MIMKKNIFKLFSVMVVSATVLTGCIEEVFPEDSTAIRLVHRQQRLRLRLMACHRKWYKAI